MLKRTAIGLVLALLMALPATAQDFEKGLPATKSPFEKGVAAYIRKDFVKAAPQMHIAAENNTAWAYLAQFYLGSMYLKGQGVPQDYAEAVMWFHKAAEQGHHNSQYNLGVAYYEGKGVRQDDAEAVNWYRKAAEQGHTQAQVNLGIMYAVGRGTPKDYVLAHMWFSFAAAKGHKKGAKALDEVVRLMAPVEIAEAEKLAREWWAKHPKKK